MMFRKLIVKMKSGWPRVGMIPPPAFVHCATSKCTRWVVHGFAPSDATSPVCQQCTDMRASNDKDDMYQMHHTSVESNTARSMNDDGGLTDE